MQIISLLYMSPGRKKKNNKSIEVTLGNYYGAELCQLIGIYIQSLSENILQKDQMILQ